MRQSLGLLTSAVSASVLLLVGCSDDGEEPVTPEGPVTLADVPPPPISGGTLMVARDGITAVAADPDRDVVWIANTQSKSLNHRVELQPGDEPGRVAEDAAGRAHVALRRGGGVAVVDIATGALLERRSVCPAPRGIAYDDAADAVHVACADGQLVSLAAATGEITRTVHLDYDLRDVIVSDGTLIVTRFRAAEALVLDDAGVVVSRDRAPTLTADQTFAPEVAWRTVALPDGKLAMVHQRAKADKLSVTDVAAYSTGICEGTVVHATVTLLEPGAGDAQSFIGLYLQRAVLPVDIAASATGERLAVIAAGTNRVLRMTPEILATGDGCNPENAAYAETFNADRVEELDVQPIAIAYAANGDLVVQTREPPRIMILDGDDSHLVRAHHAPIELPGDSRLDTGHEMFHRQAEGGRAVLACASCHVEGTDDGRVWEFTELGPRRTQRPAGPYLTMTAPFHWDGALHDMRALLSDTLNHRMGVDQPAGPNHLQALERWLAAVPDVARGPIADPEAAKRGEAIFRDPTRRCTECHSGVAFTSNETVSVGTGAAFQVPSLLNAWARAPYMHNGCAKTLADRFDPACGGTDHGDVTGLSPEDIDDLVKFIESL